MDTDLADLQYWLSVATVPCYFLVAWSWFRSGLWRSYPLFWIYIVLEGTAAAGTLLVGNNLRAVRLVYLYAQPPLWVLYVLSVLEVFQKVFAKFPGIARYGKRVIGISIAVAFLFALSSIGGDLTSGWSAASVLRRYSAITRVISSALILYLVLITIFLAWMPIPLPINTIRHSFLFFFYFLVTTGVHYILNTNAGPRVLLLNAVISVLTIVALFAWHFLLRLEGEEAPGFGVAPRATSSAMLERLEALNRALSKR